MTDETSAVEAPAPDTPEPPAPDTPEAPAPDTPAPERPRSGLGPKIGIAVLIIVLAVGGVLAYRLLQARQQAQARFDATAQLLADADEPILRIDDVVRSEVTSETVAAAEESLEDVQEADELLIEAAAELEQLPDRLSEADIAYAEAFAEAIATRRQLLADTKPVLEMDGRASGVIEPSREAWELVAQAETLSDQAIVEFNKHTKAGVQQSTALSNQAAGLLTTAQSLLATVTAGMPEANMESFVAYVGGKLGLLDRSKQIDATWLSGKIADANKLLDGYNTEEKRLAELAKTLPESPTAVIVEAYKTLTEEPTERYFTSRDAVRAADQELARMALERAR
jgi:hypothetical protein